MVELACARRVMYALFFAWVGGMCCILNVIWFLDSEELGPLDMYMIQHASLLLHIVWSLADMEDRFLCRSSLCLRDAGRLVRCSEACCSPQMFLSDGPRFGDYTSRRPPVRLSIGIVRCMSAGCDVLWRKWVLATLMR